jgi:hypothetical protein
MAIDTVMLSVKNKLIMLRVDMLIVIMLIVIMLSVVAPGQTPSSFVRHVRDGEKKVFY